MATLTIPDLKTPVSPTGNEKQSAQPLSRAQMQRVRGGRAVAVLVDGRPGGVVDDFSLNMEIFKGNIGGPMIL